MRQGQRSSLWGLWETNGRVVGFEPVADATRDVGRARKAPTQKKTGGRTATYPLFADQDNLLVRIDLSSPLPDLSQRHEERTFDIAQLPFERFADVDQEQVTMLGVEALPKVRDLHLGEGDERKPCCAPRLDPSSKNPQNRISR